MIASDRAARFWGMADKSGECWEWTGSLMGRGYGKFWIGKRLLGAHRVSWEIVNGPIPPGLFVCHTCDNPRCIRPTHLFLGTHRQNVTDAVSKGRMNRGSAHGMAKLTEADVLDIRRALDAGESRQSVSSRLRVSQRTVSRIGSRVAWRHVA